MKLTTVIAAAFFLAGLSHLSVAQSADLPVYDKDFGCIADTKANRYVQDFRIDVKSFGGIELCDAKVDTKKLFNDLLIVEEGRFNSTGSHIFVKNMVSATNYYTWLRQQTRSIRRGNDIPAATAYNSFGNFTMQDGWATSSTLGRVGTVIHEARHTEGFRHIQCTHGPYEGASTAGCDRDFAYGGSHAVEMEYYGRVVVQGQNFHPVYKSMARLMAMGRTNFVFNASPITVREVLTLVEKNGQVSVLDGDKVIARDAPATKGGVLKRTSHGASLFFGKESLALDLYGRVGAGVDTRDDYSYFKLLLLDRGQGTGPVADMEEVDIGTRRFAVGLKQDNTIASYLFEEGKWSSFARTGTTDAKIVTVLPSGEKGVFLRKPDGGVVPYDPLRRVLKTTLSERWDKQIASVATVGTQVLALYASGVVHVKTARGYEVLSTLQGKQVEQMVSSPVYNAFEVSRK